MKNNLLTKFLLVLCLAVSLAGLAMYKNLSSRLHFEQKKASCISKNLSLHQKAMVISQKINFLLSDAKLSQEQVEFLTTKRASITLSVYEQIDGDINNLNLMVYDKPGLNFQFWSDRSGKLDLLLTGMSKEIQEKTSRCVIILREY